MMMNKEHLTQEGLNKIIKNREIFEMLSHFKISQGMNTQTGYACFLKISNPIITPNWLLGFVDAEGCFYAQKKYFFFARQRG
jgi:hypothetical protein